VEYIKKAFLILILLAVLVMSSSFTYHSDSIYTINARLHAIVNEIEGTIQQSTIKAGENMIQSLGIVQVEILSTKNLDLPEPVDIEEAIPCVIVASDSILAWILCASPINASGITLNPLGIISIGEMPEEKLKEELYHWWDASRMGPLSYYATYVLEFGVLCIKNLSSNDAYWNLPLEVTAKTYATQ